MSIRRRGLALLAACVILATVALGAVSTASAQTNGEYTPTGQIQDPGIQPKVIVEDTSGQALARTGSSSTIPAAEFAVVLMVAGGFLLILARKRAERSRVAASS